MLLPIGRRARKGPARAGPPAEEAPEDDSLRLVVKNTFFDLAGVDLRDMAEVHPSGARSCAARFGSCPSSPRFGTTPSAVGEGSPSGAASEATTTEWAEHRSSSSDDEWAEERARHASPAAGPGAAAGAWCPGAEQLEVQRLLHWGATAWLPEAVPAPPAYPAPPVAETPSPPALPPALPASWADWAEEERGEPSIGSAQHGRMKADGTLACQPCAWFHKATGCLHGEGCNYCHMCPKGELKLRKQRKTAQLREQQRQKDELLAQDQAGCC